MASWADVRAVALALPEVTETATSQGSPRWYVKKALFAWERPLRRADLEALGPSAPDGDVLAAHVPDLGVRAALIAEQPELYFTTPHFADYPAVLARLEALGPDDLRELLTEAWLVRAPVGVRKAFVADQQN